jgi:hypothetical protein
MKHHARFLLEWNFVKAEEGPIKESLSNPLYIYLEPI